MTRAIYIHGTGVRKKGFEESFGLVRKNIERIREYHIVPCFWGEHLGAKLEDDPNRKLERAATSAPENKEDLQVRTWAMMDSDPWSLITVELATPKNVERDASNPADLLRSIEQGIERAITDGSRFAEELRRSGLYSLAERSAYNLIHGPIFEEYIASKHIDVGSKIVTSAMTFIALVLTEYDYVHQIPKAITGDERSNLESVLINELGGEVRSIGSSILRTSSRFLWPLVAPTIEKRRDELTKYSAPIAGDILKYFAHPNEFRRFLLQTIDTSDEDTIILSHSLGGIIAFDTLFESPRKHVKQLITIGTQIGLLHELDALPSLKKGTNIPDSFPEWINIYDTRDFLAYSCTSIILNRDMDLVVDSGSPFPRSHTSYFNNPKLYTELDKVLL